MIAFEKFLLDNGWQKHRIDKNNKRGPTQADNFSSLGDICYAYKKGDVYEEIIVGLNELHRPPTLIWPRPRVSVNGKEVGRERVGGGWLLSPHLVNDALIDRVLQQVDFETILEAMFNQELVVDIKDIQ